MFDRRQLSICKKRITILLIVAVLYFSISPPSAFAVSVTVDSTISANNPTHSGNTFTNVFTDDQTGYAFYRDASGACVYSKTTNGGTAWNSAVTVDSQTDCIRIAIWYDQWTPGNTTGTRVHIVTIDTSQDDLWYTNLDTSNDTFGTSTPIQISLPQVATFAAGANLHALTVGTDGTIYTGVQDANDSYVLRCSSNCVSATSSWSEAGTNPFDLANDWLLLLPLPQGDILATRFDISADDVQSKIWDVSSSTWSGSWTNVDTTCSNNGTYDGHFGATINKISNNIYLAFGCTLQAIGGNDDDIRTAIFNGGALTWATSTDAVTNTTSGITGVKIGLDSNTGNLYVVYSARFESATATTANLFYKISTSTTMSTWGSDQGPLNTTTTDIYGLRIDGLNNERIYATWVDVVADTLNGITVANLTPSNFEQSAHKFFSNTNSAAVGKVYAATNASSAIPMAGGAFRLRVLLHVGGDGIDIGGQYFKLQVATSTPGGCDTGFSGETYVDVATSTGDIRFYDNTSATDGVVLTSTSTDPTHSTDTIVNESYTQSNPFTNNIAKIFGGQDGKWDFALQNFSAASSSIFCFRVVENDNSLFSTYSFVPEASIDQPPVVGLVTLNGGVNISLTEGTFTLIQATATITDSNGYTDVDATQTSGRFYRSGVGENCVQDENNCYSVFDGCVLSGCAGDSCIMTCSVSMQ